MSDNLGAGEGSVSPTFFERYIVFVTNYPLTVSGKVCKVDVREGQGGLGAEGQVGPTMSQWAKEYV